MNWKRGLLLAGLNLVAAVSMIAWLESRDDRYVQENEGQSAVAVNPLASRQTDFDHSKAPSFMAVQEEQTTVIFDWCSAWVHYPVQEEVVRFGNILAFSLTGWRLVCRPRWTLSGWMMGRAWKPHDVLLQRRVDGLLCVLIVIQWLLVGGLPLTKRQNSWREPGLFITVCTLIAAALALIHPIDGLARLPALLAGLAWFWWIGLVIWKGILSAWCSAFKQNARVNPV